MTEQPVGRNVLRTGREPRPRVVILGGGFAGLGAGRSLAGCDVDVVLIDKNGYHTFQPLLYQLATDQLEEAVVGHPLADLFRDQDNVEIRRSTVTAAGLGKRLIWLDDSEPISYDYLVIGLGAGVRFFGTKGARAHSFPLYSVDDARRLLAHVLRLWTDAARDTSSVAEGALDVVITGGGPTGVECAGAMA